MGKLLSILFVAILLSGCGDTFNDIKDAASGINSKATEAASAISIDVHTVRATKIEFDNQSFTINDLFKTILRDVQWYYEQNDSKQQLKVTGTWKDNGLFDEENFNDEQKRKLLEDGKLEVTLNFNEGVLDEQSTTVQMQLHSEKLINQTGIDSLHHLYEVYTAN